MRIAAISVAPVFSEYVIGGSQKILVDMATGLKNRGHDIQIWCTGTDAHDGDFEISEVPVHPDLKLRGSFPATHQVSPVALARTSDVLKKAADWADRVYLHADAIYLRHALLGTDIIRSIHDYVYEEALVSTLSLPANVTVVPSEYLKNCIEVTVALSGRTSIEPIIVVPNGIEVPDSLPSPKLPAGISAREESDLILLFPHRPEATKGVREAILTAVKVQEIRNEQNVRLLIPAYPPGSNFDDAAGSPQEILALAEELGGSDTVELHEWLSPAEMPGYYAAGDVTLCLGSFVESFGLVPVESLANGTPAVCARVGGFRQFDDFDAIRLVEYGNTLASAHAVVGVIVPMPNPSWDEELRSGREKITERFSLEVMVSEFESVITKFLPGERKISLAGNGRLELAPWCEVQDDRIYDDYAAASVQFPELTQALESGNGFVLSDPLLLSASLDAEVRFAVDRGILIPEFVFVKT